MVFGILCYAIGDFYRRIDIMPSNIHYSPNPHELFKNDTIKQFNSMSVKDIMDNCLDTIYEFVKQEYPAVCSALLFYFQIVKKLMQKHTMAGKQY